MEALATPGPAHRTVSLYHYCGAPLGRVSPCEQQEAYFPMKPRGLWVTDDSADNWPGWCVRAQCYLDALRHCYRIELRDDARLLWLRTREEVLAFAQRYGIGESDFGLLRVSWGVRWQAVARDYAGILIIPYQPTLRFDPATAWYYTWDCASGCVWETDQIVNIREAAERGLNPDTLLKGRRLTEAQGDRYD